jgi:hypothetical protein
LREIKDEGMKILLELVEKGFDLRVVKSNGQIDLLQKYKEAAAFLDAETRTTIPGQLYILYIKFQCVQ